MKLNMKRIHLQRNQLDNRLLKIKKDGLANMPFYYWLKTTREALGIPAMILAKKIGISQPTLVNLEKSELNEKITIESLKKIAKALHCELKYAIVPEFPFNSFEDIVDAQVEKAVKKEILEMNHTMLLEKQSLDKNELSYYENDIRRRLKEKLPSNIWEL